MKGLVFHFVFCFLLMTAFVFVATPAMAIVEIAVTGEYASSRRLLSNLHIVKCPIPNRQQMI